jgi:signal-transduction protein with cAMP-binding, CBS, and nucleotidyltransferase domain
MIRIKQILAAKPSNTIYSVETSASVLSALELMASKNISSVLVIDQDELKGIFTERDYARKIILKGKASDGTAVSEVMTADLITINPETSLEECMVIMSNKHIRHLPVLEGNHVVGIISINDVVSTIIHDQKERIASLESYISGNYA